MELVNSYQKGVHRESIAVEDKCKNCECLSSDIKSKDREIEFLNKRISEMTAYEYK